jgi:hypothetical protein
MAATHEKFYNVTKAVGPGQPNEGTDVMLVQFFLKEIGEFWGLLGPAPNSMGVTPLFNHKVLKPLTVNGVADANLYNWIKWFQAIGSFGGTSAAMDGIVSPAPRRNHQGTNSKSAFSIAKMNNAFWSFFPGRWDNLASDGKVPGALQTALRNNKE